MRLNLTCLLSEIIQKGEGACWLALVAGSPSAFLATSQLEQLPTQVGNSSSYSQAITCSPLVFLLEIALLLRYAGSCNLSEVAQSSSGGGAGYLEGEASILYPL